MDYERRLDNKSLTHRICILFYENPKDDIIRDKAIKEMSLLNRFLLHMQENVMGSEMQHVMIGFPVVNTITILENNNLYKQEVDTTITCYEVIYLQKIQEVTNRKCTNYKNYFFLRLTEYEYTYLLSYCQKAVRNEIEFNFWAYCCNFLVPMYFCPMKFKGVTCAQFIIEAFIEIGLIKLNDESGERMTLTTISDMNPWYFCCCGCFFKYSRIKPKKSTIPIPEPYALTVQLAHDLIINQLSNRIIHTCPTKNVTTYK